MPLRGPTGCRTSARCPPSSTHVLGAARTDEPYSDLYVTRPDFHRQMNWLGRHGYEAVTLEQVEEAWYGGGSDLYLSDIEAMTKAGWEIAAHTIHHLDLTELDAARLEEEVAGLREVLHRQYGVPVKNFCYPSGQFDEIVIAAVKAAGYTGATTEIPATPTAPTLTNWLVTRSSAPRASPGWPSTSVETARAIY